LVVAGSLTLEDQALRDQRRFVAGLDSVTIWPAGHECVNLTWSGTGEAVAVEIALAALERLAPGDPELGLCELTVQPALHDPPLAALMRAMEAEVRAGCPSGRLYGESLSLAVASYVIARYSVPGRRPARARGGLSRRQLSSVLDYIRANLGNELGVAQLASVARLSPSHFIQAFRASMRITPHQYLLRQRIAEAQGLLAAGHMSVAEVAFAVGFTSQSHFGGIFRRVVGTSPRRYQRESWPPTPLVIADQ
jgi:AraC family transcriptional regulator